MNWTDLLMTILALHYISVVMYKEKTILYLAWPDLPPPITKLSFYVYPHPCVCAPTYTHSPTAREKPNAAATCFDVLRRRTPRSGSSTTSDGSFVQVCIHAVCPIIWSRVAGRATEG